MANTGRKIEDVTPGPSSTGYKPNDFFWTTRRKEHSLSGTIIFVVLRLLDLPLQWYLLRSGLGIQVLRKLGATPVTTPSSTPITFLGLSPYHTLVFALAVGSSLKQIYWKLFIGEQLFAPGFATVVSIYNTLLNSFNTFLALWALTSQQPAEQQSLGPMLVFPPDSVKVGKILFGVGMYLEWYSEIQRKDFKKDERNRGKPYCGGLWSLARNINYGGYTLWRCGYSLICGGWVWAALQAAWLSGDFINRAIPSMEAYCEKRYSQQWEQVRMKVPYRLLPWIY